MKITKSYLKRLISEAAAEYVWGVKNAGRVANQYKIAKEIDVGIVCSGQEAKDVRKILGTKNLIFTPGIRMDNENTNDQQRVCTPNESLENGSNKIIMGRSLIKGDITENLNRVLNSLKA